MQYRYQNLRDALTIEISMCEYFNVTQKQLHSSSRKKGLVEIRHILFYILNHEMHFSLPFVGERFNRDHTTVLHGVRKIVYSNPESHLIQKKALFEAFFDRKLKTGDKVGDNSVYLGEKVGVLETV